MMNVDQELELSQRGYVLLKSVFSRSLCADIIEYIHQQLDGDCYKIRDVLRKHPVICNMIAQGSVSLADEKKVRRSVLFQKPQDYNWSVPWHQDILIQVQEKLNADSYSAWSEKEGVVHVQPPLTVMQSILSMRIHLTTCGNEDGPLMVIPESHKEGYIPFAGLGGYVSDKEVEICAEIGDVLLFSPLLLHSSQKVTSDEQRCVLHLELSGYQFDNGLQWN